MTAAKPVAHDLLGSSETTSSDTPEAPAVVALFGPRGAPHALQVNSEAEAEVALIAIMMGAINLKTDDGCRAIIKDQYHCVTRHLIIEHLNRKLGYPTTESLTSVLTLLRAKGWPVRGIS